MPVRFRPDHGSCARRHDTLGEDRLLDDLEAADFARREYRIGHRHAVVQAVPGGVLSRYTVGCN